MSSPALPPEIVGLLLTGRGVFTAHAATQAGTNVDRLQRIVRAGLLTCVGQGVYASTADLARANPWVAHAIRARGFVVSRRNASFAAGWSAVAIRGLPTLGPPPTLPTVVQPGRTGHGTRQTRYGVVHTRELPSTHHAQVAGCPVVGKAWMVVDLARTARRADALVVADAVLRDGGTNRGFERALSDMHRWAGSAAAAWVVEHADGRAETAIETLGRLACVEGGLAVPLSNVWIGDGRPQYRVDHLWPWHWVVAEADGALKYRDCDDPARVVAEEKEPEWQLRRLGIAVVRYGWELAAHRREDLAARLARVLADNPVRAEPVPWWPTRNPFIGQNGQIVA